MAVLLESVLIALGDGKLNDGLQKEFASLGTIAKPCTLLAAMQVRMLFSGMGESDVAFKQFASKVELSEFAEAVACPTPSFVFQASYVY